MIEAVKKQIELCDKFIEDNIILGKTMTKDCHDSDVIVESIEDIRVNSKSFRIYFKCRTFDDHRTDVLYCSDIGVNDFNNDIKKVYSLQLNKLKPALKYHTQKMYEYTQKIQQLEKEL